MNGLKLLKRLSNVFTSDPNSNLGQLLESVGQQLDAVDPQYTNLSSQFALSTATGTALDAHGKDWGVLRRYNETDSSYRSRIQAVLPISINGPTRSAISLIVKNFTGYDPLITEFGPDSFTMGVSPMGSFVFNSSSDLFGFQIQVQNPNGVNYVRNDMTNAVNVAKPARSTVTIIHQGGV